MGRMKLTESRTNSGFSLPLIFIFLVILIVLFILFGWIVLPIAAGIFLLITTFFAIFDRIKRIKNHKHHPLAEELTITSKLDSLNLILYRAIFNRTEEQAKDIADDLKKRGSLDSIDSVISEIQNELNAPTLGLADLHPYSGNPTEEEIRAFLTMVLRELKNNGERGRSG
jgi:uncharacterized membrane protein